MTSNFSFFQANPKSVYYYNDVIIADKLIALSKEMFVKK